jgi:hypothetical protein
VSSVFPSRSSTRGEECATTAAELGQWDFQLAVAPVRLAGTSGSPVNPIATF